MTTKLNETLGKLKNIPILSSLPNLPKKVIWVIIVSIVVLAGAGGGYAYYQSTQTADESTSTSELQTAMATRGDLVIYASGTGTLVSANETELSFTSTGKVTEVNVTVGEKVEAGTQLAKLDDTDAQATYAEANRAYLELTSPSAIATAQQSIADATSDVSDAKNTLAYIISPEALQAEEKVEEAQTAIAEAEAKLKESPTDTDAKKALEDAQSDLEASQELLAQAQGRYTSYYLPKYFTDGKELNAPSEAEILAARADYEFAKATLQEAKWLYAALTGEEIPEDATGSGLTELEQACLNLESAKATLDGTQIIAPYAGTVMSIDISVGDSVSSGSSAITLADLTQPYLEVYLDESDWSSVVVGYETDVIFDILPDKTFSGVVTQVDPGLYSSNNTSVVRAFVKLTQIDEESFTLPLGTTASVDVIGGRAENAVLVPIEALHKAGDQYAVFIMENDKPILHVVEVGIQDLLYAEIISGVKEGDLVTTGIVETQ
ncbi:MAG TPA: efflux RND transporter periplasmic adaptor subunit [Anaerolineales bacterium]|nr:efflux RND transporter periplasmic adaptor subunit [Anaerolineales bacterium]